MIKYPTTFLMNKADAITGNGRQLFCAPFCFSFLHRRLINVYECLKTKALKCELNDYKRLIEGNEFDNQMNMKNVRIAAMESCGNLYSYQQI